MVEETIEKPVLWAIYGMRLEDETEYRYIGLTRIGIERRLYIHKRDALRRPHHVSKWVNKNSDSITIEVIEACPEGDEDYLFDAEIRWIKHFRDLGHPLTNHGDGGASGSFGARWTIPEEKRRAGENHPNYGKPMSETTKDMLRKSKLGKKRTEESRRKQGDSIRGENHWMKQIDREVAAPGRKAGFVLSDETRRKLSDAQKNRPPVSEETRRKISEANKGKVISPEHRAKISAAISGEKHHAYGKPAWNAGVSMSDEKRAQFDSTRAINGCRRWHQARSYVDPDCKVCVERVATGEVERFFTPNEIISAKKAWADARDPEEVARHSEKMKKAQSNRPPVTDEHRAKLSAAGKGRPGKPASDETRAKQSAAKKGRLMGDAQRQGMMLGLHKKWHADRGITKPGCEFCGLPASLS